MITISIDVFIKHFLLVLFRKLKWKSMTIVNLNALNSIIINQATV